MPENFVLKSDQELMSDDFRIALVCSGFYRVFVKFQAGRAAIGSSAEKS